MKRLLIVLALATAAGCGKAKGSPECQQTWSHITKLPNFAEQIGGKEYGNEMQTVFYKACKDFDKADHDCLRNAKALSALRGCESATAKVEKAGDEHEKSRR